MYIYIYKLLFFVFTNNIFVYLNSSINYINNCVKKTRNTRFLSVHTQLGPRGHYVIACLRQSGERQKETNEMESVLFQVFLQGPGIDRLDGGEIGLKYNTVKYQIMGSLAIFGLALFSMSYLIGSSDEPNSHFPLFVTL